MILNSKEILLLQRIKDDESYSNWFFRKAQDLKWFYPLKDDGWFLPDKIPQSETGDYLFWNVLDYLEKVSQQIDKNSELGKELIDIIESIVQFSLNQVSQNKKPVNNYAIWRSCALILNNLPIDIIIKNLPLEDRDENGRKKYGFQTWLKVWTGYPFNNIMMSIADIGEKLLPKFLNDDSTIEYAVEIISAITDVRSNGEIEPLTNSEKAVLNWSPYLIKKAFEKSGADIADKCSNKVIFGLADKLKKVLKLKQKNSYVHVDVGEDIFRISVSRQPADDLTKSEIKFKENFYKCDVKKFEPDQIKNLDKDDRWSLHTIDPQTIEQFSFEAENKEVFVKNLIAQLPLKIEWVRVIDLDEKIKTLFNGLNSDYLYIWFPSLAEGNADNADSPEEILPIILQDVLIAKCQQKSDDAREILENFLGDNYLFPTFRRLVLVCINQLWNKYSGLFTKFLETVPDAFEWPDFAVELFDILQKHNSDSKFKVLENKISKIINDVPQYYLQRGEKLIAYWKYKWLSPLKDNPKFLKDYEKALKEAEIENNQPYSPERSGAEASWITNKSPLSKEEILSKPIEEIIKYLNDFKGPDFTSFGKPDKEGLAGALEAAVIGSPIKFINEIEAFHKVNYFYVHRLLRGLVEAWNKRVAADWNWEKIFDFCLKYLDRDENVFLAEALAAQGPDSGGGKYLWVIEDIANLIDDVSRNDKNDFVLKNSDKIEQIFNLIIPKLKGENHPDTQRDALTYALNTTLGRTVVAYISFSLHRAKNTADKEKNWPKNWGNDKYKRFFASGIEAHIWFGCYLPQMKYLDEEYAGLKIKDFAQKSSGDFEWQMFMEGYLTGSRVYKDIYGLMRNNYLECLKKTDLEDRVEKRLVQHLCLGYLHEYESLKPENSDGQASLFYKMLTEAGAKNKHNRWLAIPDFFWSRTDRTVENGIKNPPDEKFKKVIDRIIEFWKWASEEGQNTAKANLGEDYNSFLGKMAKLTILLNEIDEEKKNWLLLSAPYVDLDHNSSFFIEYLTKFEDADSLKNIGEIFKKVLEMTTPTFRQENIELIVRRIYKKGNSDDAIEIINTYGRRGLHFLRHLLEEFQKKGAPD